MLSQKKRFEVLKRDNFRCQYCGKTGKDVTLEVDHIKPRSKWGTDDMENLITCCRECNMGKWNEEINSWDSTYQIKLNDFEWKLIKQFFQKWNDEIHITIDQRNISFVANFIKRNVEREIKDIKPRVAETYIDEDIDSIEQKAIEFYRWKEIFDEVTSFMEWFIRSDQIEEPIEECENDDSWNTDNYNERLNYTLTRHLKLYDHPPYWIIKKYSLYPNIEV